MASTEAARREAHERRCTATSSQSGKPCRAYAVKGLTVCWSHGGAAPQARAKAERRIAVEEAEADAARVLAHTAIRPLQDPLEELARLTAEAVAWKDALAARVNALATIRYTAPGSGAEQIRGEVLLLERAIAQLTKLLDLMAKHGWEQRRVQLAERNGQLLAGVVQAVLGQLHLTTEQRELSQVVVPAEFRKVAELEQRRAEWERAE